jgi:hypothetical protein
VRVLKAGVLVAVAGLWLAGCAGVGGPNSPAGLAQGPSPERPGTRIQWRNPDEAKWQRVRATRQVADPRSGRTQKLTTIWSCRPLACAGNAAVATESVPSPTRDPDRTALERIAKLIPAEIKARDVMMEAASEGDERMTPLGTRISEVRGYPAILTETRRTSRGKHRYLYRGDVFVGMLIVRVIALSGDRAEAKRSFDAFMAALDIADVAPGAPAAEPDPVAYETPPAEPVANQ